MTKMMNKCDWLVLAVVLLVASCGLDFNPPTPVKPPTDPNALVTLDAIIEDVNLPTQQRQKAWQEREKVRSLIKGESHGT